MNRKTPPSATPLRIFCLEDNPLIVFHLEQMIEDLGHVFAGSSASFMELQQRVSTIEMDCALVDIDLADGASGPSAAAWLLSRGIPCAFVTGQEAVAARFPEISVATVGKPINKASLVVALDHLRIALS